MIASLYFQKLVSFLTFLKLQVSETCSQESQLLMRLRRKSLRASSIVPRIPRNQLHERESYNQHTIHPEFLKELQTVLSNCFEDIWNVKGASGQGKPRRLQFPRRNGDDATWTLLQPASPMKHLPLWIHPVPAGKAAPSPRARAQARAPRARKRNSKSGCA